MSWFALFGMFLKVTLLIADILRNNQLVSQIQAQILLDFKGQADELAKRMESIDAVYDSMSNNDKLRIQQQFKDKNSDRP